MKRIAAVTAVALIVGAVSLQALPLDLRGGAATPVSYAGAYWSTFFDQSSGTGVWNPFFDLKASPTELGYNTDGALLMDQHRASWNTDLPNAILIPVTIPGVAGEFYAFWLDSNETGGGSEDKYLSIDYLKIYVSDFASISVANEDDLIAACGYAGNPLYDMGAGNSVWIDSTIGATSGSGSSDLIVYIPTSLFAGIGDEKFVYMWNGNGFTGGDLEANSGFEEWHALTGTRSVPDGGITITLLGAALLSLAAVRRMVRG